MRLVASLLLIFGTLAGAAAENTLTPAEKKEGWTLLFDGKTMNGWLDPAKKDKPGTGWKVEDGTLATVQGALIREDLITAKSYDDFELKFDWKLTPGGNTGLKYRIQRELLMDQSKMEKGPGAFEGIVGREIANPKSDRKTLAPDAKAELYTIAFEFQLLDDERHPDAKKGHGSPNGRAVLDDSRHRQSRQPRRRVELLHSPSQRPAVRALDQRHEGTRRLAEGPGHRRRGREALGQVRPAGPRHPQQSEAVGPPCAPASRRQRLVPQYQNPDTEIMGVHACS
jgi:hypothetical protein